MHTCVEVGHRRPAGHVGRAAFVGGLNQILLVAAGVAFAGALLSFALIRGRDFVREY